MLWKWKYSVYILELEVWKYWKLEVYTMHSTIYIMHTTIYYIHTTHKNQAVMTSWPWCRATTSFNRSAAARLKRSSQAKSLIINALIGPFL